MSLHAVYHFNTIQTVLLYFPINIYANVLKQENTNMIVLILVIDLKFCLTFFWGRKAYVT